MSVSYLRYEQLKGLDLVREFAERSEITIQIDKKQKHLLERSWDRYAKYASAEAAAPGGVKAKLQLTLWVLFDLYCSIRYLYLPEITRLYIREAQRLLPVEFRAEEDGSIAVVFRRAQYNTNGVQH